MTKDLPGKKSFSRHLADVVKDLFWLPGRPARINAETLRKNNQDLIQFYEKRDLIQQQIQIAQMQLQDLMQQRTFDFQDKQGNLLKQFQAEEGKLNRQLQAELARLNREFQAEEGKLNRQLQAELAKLNREFQAQEGRLNRENACKLEIYRARLQLFLQEQQKEFQLQLKEIDAALAKKLKTIDLQNNLTVIRQQRRLNNWPLTLDDEQIKEIVTSDNLLILFVPPILKYDRAGAGANNSPNSFPDIEQGLNRRVRAFIDKYKQNGRNIDFLTGVWMTKALSGEGAFKTIFSGLKNKSVLAINTLVERSNYHLEYSYWNHNFQEPYIDSLPKEEPLYWPELLYDATKERLLQWEEQRNSEAKEKGTTNEFDRDWGPEVVKKFLADLELVKRENRLLERGQNPENILSHNYTVLDSDRETFCRLLAIQICLLIGKLADEYFLLYLPPKDRQPPLLPELLPTLLKKIPSEYKEKIVEAVVSFYQALYKQLGETESAWIPEMLLDLARSFIYLDNKSWAKEQIEKSVKCWLEMRGIKSLEQVSNLEIMNFLITQNTTSYMESLKQCLELIPEENLTYAQTLYLTWNNLRETHQRKLAESQNELEQPKFEPIQRFVY